MCNVVGEPESGRGSVLRIRVSDEADDPGLHAAAVAGLGLPAAAARAAALAAALTRRTPDQRVSY